MDPDVLENIQADPPLEAQPSLPFFAREEVPTLSPPIAIRDEPDSGVVGDPSNEQGTWQEMLPRESQEPALRTERPATAR